MSEYPSTCDAAVIAFIAKMQSEARHGPLSWRLALFTEDIAGWRTIIIDTDVRNDPDVDILWGVNRLARILGAQAAAYVDEDPDCGVVVHVERRGADELATFVLGRGDAPIQRTSEPGEAFWVVPGGTEYDGWGCTEQHDSIRRGDATSAGAPLDHEQPTMEHAVVAVLGHLVATAPTRTDEQLQYFLLVPDDDCVRVVSVDVGTWPDFGSGGLQALAALAGALGADGAIYVETIGAGLSVDVHVRGRPSGVRYLLRRDPWGVWADALEVSVSQQPFVIIPGPRSESSGRRRTGRGRASRTVIEGEQ